MGSSCSKGKKTFEISTRVVGQTFGSHLQFMKKLKHRGSKKAFSERNKDVIIVFCPIVSRFMTDVQSALSDVSGFTKIILVAMHYTQDPNYTLPDYRHIDNHENVILVECLFFEKTGLFDCPCNDQAVARVCKELNLPTKKKLIKEKNK